MHNIVIYTVSHKQETSNLRQQLHQTLTNFRHFFTDRFLENFATKWLLKIPPHLIRVASLPCKRRLYENKTPRNTNTNCPPLHTRKTYTRATHRGGRYNFHWKKQKCIKFSKKIQLSVYFECATERQSNTARLPVQCYYELRLTFLKDKRNI